MANQLNPYATPQEYTFVPTTARYIKINATKLGIPASNETMIYRMQLAEIEAFTSGNLAENKTVNSNSSLEYGYMGTAILTDGWNVNCNTIFVAPDSSMSTWKNISDKRYGGCTRILVVF